MAKNDESRVPTDEERELALAEARKCDAEIAKLVEETRETAARAALSELLLQKEQEKRQKELAGNEHHLFYSFNSTVDAATVNKCIDQLTVWMRTRPLEPIEIQFNSPGGSIVDGMALWDFIQTIRANGHRVTTSTIGYAASMAGILLQAGDHRVMGRESYLMIHEAAFGVQGKVGEVDDRVEWVKKIQDRILNIFADRSNLSKAQIKRRWTRKDWWLDSDESLRLGFVDEVR